jgi:molybdopterin-guanine dinucleotide biosynthesis protein B
MDRKKCAPMISFVARTGDSGKTTLIEQLVKILKSRGLNVAVIKHASKGFDLDKPGKDSWRYEQAGADTVALVGPHKLAIMRRLDHDPDPAELADTLDADVVFIEGFKKTAVNKIEVFRAGVSGERPLCMDDPSYRALVSDRRFDVPIPFFDLNDAAGVGNFILQECMRR